MPLFKEKIIKEQKQDEKILNERYENLLKFQAKIEKIKEFKEEEYQTGFLQDIFENCLGYTLKTTNPQNFNLEREKKNKNNSKKCDGAILDKNGEVIGVIELKDQKTHSLDKIENQAFDYHNSQDKNIYIIISNFDEIRFYIEKKTAYEKFNLLSMTRKEFEFFHIIFSYESIIANLPKILKEKSENSDNEISKKLYADFSEFRLKLFENAAQENSQISQKEILSLVQKLCDRIIFVLFAEDYGLLKSNFVADINAEWQNQKFTDFSLYEIWQKYFEAIDKGNQKLGVENGYNGGLFATDETLNSLKFSDEILQIYTEKLSSYDFASEVGVNILGHIFEQSLSDLEELTAEIENKNFDKNQSKRKKDGIFYTPEYIVKFIIEQTLGQICENKKAEFGLNGEIIPPKNPKKLNKSEKRLLQNIYAYRDFLLNLKIIDPACGSGAFLNQALNFLIKEHKFIDKYRKILEDEALSYYDIEPQILENNLFGVDINEDAVQIAKLSLWLRTAQKGRKLTNLSNNIKCANSLLDFPFDFKFDCVIGNPPYGAKDAKMENETTTESYILFFYKGFELLKKNGYLGYITPDSWLTNINAKKLRKLFIDNGSIRKIRDTYKIFNDAPDVWCDVTIFQKDFKAEFTEISRDFPYNLPIFQFKISWQDIVNFGENEWFIYINPNFKQIFEKMNKNENLENFFEVKRGFSPTPNDKNITLTKTNRQIIGGEDFGKYIYKIKPKFLINEYEKSRNQIDEILKSDFIGIQRIRTNSLNFSSSWLVAQYFSNGFVPIDSIGYFLQKSNLKLKFLLAIINSKLMNLYYKLHYTDKNVKPIYLKKLPIPNLDDTDQQPFIDLADKLIELNSNLQTTKTEFLRELNLEKIPQKLAEFEILEFDEFIKEYAKAKKEKFADKLAEVKFKNYYESFFSEYKSQVLSLKSQISQSENELNLLVYKLYDLDTDEIALIENA